MKLYRETSPSNGKYVLRPVDPENTESVLNFVEPFELPTEEDIMKILRESRWMGDSAKAIVSLIKGE